MLQIALLRWKPGTSPDQVAEVMTVLREFHAKVDGIVSFECGPDLGPGGANQYDFAMVTRFVDRDAWQAYMDHPDHHPTSDRYVLPITAEVAVVLMAG